MFGTERSLNLIGNYTAVGGWGSFFRGCGGCLVLDFYCSFERIKVRKWLVKNVYVL